MLKTEIKNWFAEYDFGDDLVSLTKEQQDICNEHASEILSKILEAVDGAGLTLEEKEVAINEGIAKALSLTYKKVGLTDKEYNSVKAKCIGDAVAIAQLQAIKKLFEGEVCDGCPTFEKGCEGSNQEDCGREEH